VSHDKWNCDLQSIAKIRTKNFFKNFNNFSFKLLIDNRCTYENEKKYFSHRRDGLTGRMASVISVDCSRVSI
jgi:copper oxidase (laccase) domain-containing protein